MTSIELRGAPSGLFTADQQVASTSAASHNFDPIPRRNLAALDHLRINPAVAVAEGTHQRFRDVEVAQPG